MRICPSKITVLATDLLSVIRSMHRRKMEDTAIDGIKGNHSQFIMYIVADPRLCLLGNEKFRI